MKCTKPRPCIPGLEWFARRSHVEVDEGVWPLLLKDQVVWPWIIVADDRTCARELGPTGCVMELPKQAACLAEPAHP
jgi:hypothetical protein